MTEPSREVAFVFQDYGRALLPWRTVEGNVSLALEAAGVPAGERARAHRRSARARSAWRRMRSKFPVQLSGGMQQRVQIARCLAQRPELMMMDEPFGALDAMTRQSLQDELARLVRDDGLTVLFVTHDLEEAIYLGDRVIALQANPAPGRPSLAAHDRRADPAPARPARRPRSIRTSCGCGASCSLSSSTAMTDGRIWRRLRPWSFRWCCWRCTSCTRGAPRRSAATRWRRRAPRSRPSAAPLLDGSLLAGDRRSRSAPPRSACCSAPRLGVALGIALGLSRRAARDGLRHRSRCCGRCPRWR